MILLTCEQVEAGGRVGPEPRPQGDVVELWDQSRGQTVPGGDKTPKCQQIKSVYVKSIYSQVQLRLSGSLVSSSGP